VTDTRLVLPYDVEGMIVDVLIRRHPEHLAKAERLRGLAPRTFEQFKTIVRMSDAAAERLPGDTVPACLLGVVGAPTFRRNEMEAVDAVLQLGVQVTVMGQRRRDTLYRRDVMAWTTVECMYQRLPRGSNGMISDVRLTDYEPVSESEKQRTLGDARMMFEIGVRDMLSITGYLPTDDTVWPPEAGGAPDDPYTPPEPLPTATPTFTIDRTPIAE